jgi:ribosomal protein S18 acetylase RimI-like enzyme
VSAVDPEARRVGALPGRPAIDGSDIRLMSDAEVAPVAASLARAFEDDPVMSWCLPRDEQRLMRLERGFAFYLRRIWLRQEHCYAIDGLFGAALWLPPAAWRLSFFEQLRLLPGVASITGRDLPRMLRLIRLIEEHHPTDREHFYLAVLGIAPEAQGRGFGSALMRPVLERCDRERTGAYLEASSARSRALYERVGFEVVEELRLPDGPAFWPMWREPRG